MSQCVWAQTTETFETETVGSTTFTDSGQDFTITGTNYDINSLTGGGWSGSAPDNVFIDNTGESAGNDGTTMTIKTADGTDINVLSVYIFAANTSLGAHSDILSVTGKRDNAEVYTFSKSTGFSNVASFSPFNGFTLIDFAVEGSSDFSIVSVDELIISSTDDLEYMAIDAFTWNTPSSVPTSVTVSARTFLEGPYNGTSMNTNIVSDIPLSQPYTKYLFLLLVYMFVTLQ